MNYKMTFDYTDNTQLKENYKVLLKSKGFTMKKLQGIKGNLQGLT